MAVLPLVVLLSSVALSGVCYSYLFVCKCELNWADFNRFMPYGMRLKPWIPSGQLGDKRRDSRPWGTFGWILKVVIEALEG